MGQSKPWNHKDLKKIDKIPEFNDVKGWIKHIEKNAYNIHDLPGKYRTKYHINAALKNYPLFIQYLEQHEKTNHVCQLAFNRNIRSYIWIPEELRTEEMSYCATSFAPLQLTTLHSERVIEECLKRDWSEYTIDHILESGIEYVEKDKIVRIVNRLKLLNGPPVLRTTNEEILRSMHMSIGIHTISYNVAFTKNGVMISKKRGP